MIRRGGNDGAGIAVNAGMDSSSTTTAPAFAEPLATVVERRAAGITTWLTENAPDTFEQHEHLQAGTPEQAYWHYGYLAALRDVQNYLERREANRN